MKITCKTRRVNHDTHVDVRTCIYFIPRKISSDCKFTFGFTQARVRRYLRGLSDSVLRTQKHNLCMALFLYLQGSGTTLYEITCMPMKFTNMIYKYHRGNVIFTSSFLIEQVFWVRFFFASHTKLFGTEVVCFDVHLRYACIQAKLFLPGSLAASAEGWLGKFFILCMKHTFSIWKQRVLRIFSNIGPNNCL